jgi:hypothetical protein
LRHKTRAGTTYFLEVEREGDRSNHSCDYKTRAGTTYFLEVEREGDRSNHSCDYKTRAGTTYFLEVERATSQTAVVNTNENGDNIHPGSGEVG